MEPLFFQTGADNPLFRFDLRPDLAAGDLIGLGIVLALLLGHAAYTDVFCGKVIRNTTNMAIAAAALAVVPLVYERPLVHLAWAAGIIVALGLIWFIGAIAAGDLKLYSALAILLGPAAIALVFISFVVIIVYSVPLMIRTRRQVRATGQELPRGERLGKPAAAPGIALSVPLTLWAAGVEPLYVAALAGGIVAAAALYRLTLPKLDEGDEADEADSGAAEAKRAA